MFPQLGRSLLLFGFCVWLLELLKSLKKIPLLSQIKMQRQGKVMIRCPFFLKSDDVSMRQECECYPDHRAQKPIQGEDCRPRRRSCDIFDSLALIIKSFLAAPKEKKMNREKKGDLQFSDVSHWLPACCPQGKKNEQKKKGGLQFSDVSHWLPVSRAPRIKSRSNCGGVCVYYCRTYDKAVCGGGGGQ